MGLLADILAIFGRRKGEPDGLEPVDIPDYAANRAKYDFRTDADVAATPGTEATEKALDRMLMPVVSSWVQGVKYLPDKRRDGMGTLYVGFHDGALVAYDDTPLGLYDEMFAAGSKGRFVHAMLKGRSYRTIVAGKKRKRA